MFSVTPDAVPEIVSMKVMPAIEAAYLILHTISRPDDAPVLVVELRGDFAVSGPQGFVLTGTASFMVFDASTGNLLQVNVDDANRLK
jgi:hypothetical protein